MYNANINNHMKPEFNTIIVHFDEIALKGNNQNFFVKKLIEQIQKKLGLNITKGAKKLIIELKPETSIEESLESLRLIPGISNVAPAIFCKTDFKEMKKAAVSVAKFYQPKTFKISTRRAYKQFELDSQEVSREVGAEVLRNTEDITVDVKTPELEIRIEIEKEKTAVLGKKEQGVGGLPVGTSGKMITLLSGGIDSPVAAYMMMKRGARVKFIHFHNQTINRVGVEDKIKDLVSQLSKVQGQSSLFIVPFADLQKAVIASIPADLRMIVYRRLMYRIAERVARREKAQALITGDSLAQVASQTLENMNVIYEATDMLKLAPLAGLNKLEITKISQQIGTYEISIRPYEDCCSLMIAKHPETRGKLDQILEVEKALDVDALVDLAIKSIKTYKL